MPTHLKPHLNRLTQTQMQLLFICELPTAMSSYQNQQATPTTNFCGCMLTHTQKATTSVDAGASLGASLRELASEAAAIQCVCTASDTQAKVNRTRSSVKHGKAISYY